MMLLHIHKRASKRGMKWNLVALSLRLEYNGMISAHCNLRLLVSSHYPGLASQVAGIIVTSDFLIPGGHSEGDMWVTGVSMAQLRRESHSVAQVGVQRRNLGAFQPLSPRFKYRVSLCHPGWNVMVQCQLTPTSAYQVQAILLPQPPNKESFLPCWSDDLKLLTSDSVLFCHPSWSAMTQSQLTATSTYRVQAIFLPQLP
ncbi:putative phosphatidylinositol 3,4,5-trisphosphate 3-phosphatase TPTE2P1, partial [Plecturocebus cupreus]